MIMTDFIFDSQLLSDYECVIGYMNTSSSNSIDMGSEITFETFYNGRTFETDNLRAKYETPITATFDILKSQCDVGSTDSIFLSDTELSQLMIWLNSPTSKTFMPIYDDESYDGISYKGTFTSIQQINTGKGCVGITVTFTATSPWGFDTERTVHKTFDTINTDSGLSAQGINISNTDIDNGIFQIVNDSDNIGYLYPDDVVITIKQDGDFEITNSLDPKHTVCIKNCLAGEVLTMDSKHQIITSNYYKPEQNVKTHELFYNDFNYNFFRLVRTNSETVNEIQVNLPCEISFTYSPIRKVGVIV